MYVCNGFLNTQNTPTWVLSLNAARSIEVHLRPYAIIGKFPMQLWEFCLQLLVFLLCTKHTAVLIRFGATELEIQNGAESATIENTLRVIKSLF